VSEIDRGAAVTGFLRRLGLVGALEHPVLTPLTGGVSSDLWKVDLVAGAICVKAALPQLKVADTWFAPVSRNGIEYEWLRFAQPLRPGQVPRVLGHDKTAGLFAMEFLPPAKYPVWKTLLLAGEVDVRSAIAVGDLIGDLHSASATDLSNAIRFATDDNFEALRIAPYLRVTARAHPDLQERFAMLAERTATTHLAVVHGDVSPKNILLGPHGPVLLDAECAWFGDPAFDVAFCLNHLLIKSVKVPHRASAFHTAALALADAHASRVDWEPPSELLGRVVALLPALTLARVDGSSPVEYLDDRERRIVRAIGRELLGAPSADLDELLDRWATLAGRGRVGAS
jgi:hypothetical protein